MADATYDVEANIVLDANKALRQSVQLSSRMMKLGRQIQGVNSGSNRMLRNSPGGHEKEPNQTCDLVGSLVDANCFCFSQTASHD